MPRRLTLLMIGACTNALVALPAWAQAAPEITLTRLDCGTPRGTAADLGFNFSDTFGDNVPNIRLVLSCYLIKHGDDYMVWDTGFGMSAGRVAPKTSLIDLLAQANVKPDQIKYVGISHYHADHVGQMNSFLKATLLIGKGDWDILSGPKLPPSVRRPPGDVVNPEPFVNWISGVGDATVIMLNTPGHTPGHHVLLVKLPRTGNGLLSGDLMKDEETGRTTIFRKPSNYSNGNTRDRQGRLVTCEHGARRVTRTELPAGARECGYRSHYGAPPRCVPTTDNQPEG